VYYVYILECADQTLYTGSCADLARRVKEHNFGNNGAKYTRGRRPVKLVFSQKFRTRSRACVKEIQLKKLTRLQKLAIIKKGEINFEMSS